MSLITYRSRVHFADRVLEDALAEEIGRNAMRRPLVLIAPHLVGGDRHERLMDALPVTLVPETLTTDPGQPAQADARRAAPRLSNGGCDGIIAFGGSREIGIARVLGTGGLPILAVPTTTDTIGLGPVAHDLSGARAARTTLPAAILCDPTLTVEMGPAETAAAGMSTLVRCLESYLSTAFNPPADGMALDGLRRAFQSLEAAVDNGADLAARRELLAAALNAGLAAEKGFGGIEAAAQGLQVTTLRRPGAFLGALLPKVLEFNAPAIVGRRSAIRKELGLPTGGDIAMALTDLARRVGLPLRLSEAGIAAPVLPKAAHAAATATANRTNPRHATATDYETMLRAAL